MKMKTHREIIASILTLCADRRVKHPPAAIRWARRKGLPLQDFFYDRYASASRLDFRPHCGSGRALFWQRGYYSQIAAGIADLVRRGYTVADARRISRQLMTSESHTVAVPDPPPAEFLGAAVECYGWAPTRAAEVGTTTENVCAWTAWRHHARKLCAQHGRRTKRFYEVAEAWQAAKEVQK